MSDYQPNFDVSGIYELGNAWIDLSDRLWEQVTAMDGAVHGMRWTGDANTVVQNTWNDLHSLELQPAVDSARSIGNHINAYGDYIAQVMAQEQAQADAQALAGLIGSILSLPLMIFPGLGGAIGKGLGAALTKILPELIVNIIGELGGAIAATLPAAVKFAGPVVVDVIGQAGIQLGIDLASTAIADTVYHVPIDFSSPEFWKGEAVNLGLAGGLPLAMHIPGAVGPLASKLGDKTWFHADGPTPESALHTGTGPGHGTGTGLPAPGRVEPVVPVPGGDPGLFPPGGTGRPDTVLTKPPVLSTDTPVTGISRPGPGPAPGDLTTRPAPVTELPPGRSAVRPAPGGPPEVITDHPAPLRPVPAENTGGRTGGSPTPVTERPVSLAETPVGGPGSRPPAPNDPAAERPVTSSAPREVAQPSATPPAPPGAEHSAPAPARLDGRPVPGPPDEATRSAPPSQSSRGGGPGAIDTASPGAPGARTPEATTGRSVPPSTGDRNAVPATARPEASAKPLTETLSRPQTPAKPPAEAPSKPDTTARPLLDTPSKPDPGPGGPGGRQSGRPTSAEPASTSTSTSTSAPAPAPAAEKLPTSADAGRGRSAAAGGAAKNSAAGPGRTAGPPEPVPLAAAGPEHLPGDQRSGGPATHAAADGRGKAALPADASSPGGSPDGSHGGPHGGPGSPPVGDEPTTAKAATAAPEGTGVAHGGGAPRRSEHFSEPGTQQAWEAKAAELRSDYRHRLALEEKYQQIRDRFRAKFDQSVHDSKRVQKLDPDAREQVYAKAEQDLRRAFDEHTAGLGGERGKAADWRRAESAFRKSADQLGGTFPGRAELHAAEVHLPSRTDALIARAEARWRGAGLGDDAIASASAEYRADLEHAFRRTYGDLERQPFHLVDARTHFDLSLEELAHGLPGRGEFHRSAVDLLSDTGDLLSATMDRWRAAHPEWSRDEADAIHQEYRQKLHDTFRQAFTDELGTVRQTPHRDPVAEAKARVKAFETLRKSWGGPENDLVSGLRDRLDEAQLLHERSPVTVRDLHHFELESALDDLPRTLDAVTAWTSPDGRPPSPDALAVVTRQVTAKADSLLTELRDELHGAGHDRAAADTALGRFDAGLAALQNSLPSLFTAAEHLPKVSEEAYTVWRGLADGHHGLSDRLLHELERTFHRDWVAGYDELATGGRLDAAGWADSRLPYRPLDAATRHLVSTGRQDLLDHTRHVVSLAERRNWDLEKLPERVDEAFRAWEEDSGAGLLHDGLGEVDVKAVLTEVEQALKSDFRQMVDGRDLHALTPEQLTGLRDSWTAKVDARLTGLPERFDRKVALAESQRTADHLVDRYRGPGATDPEAVRLVKDRYAKDLTTAVDEHPPTGPQTPSSDTLPGRHAYAAKVRTQADLVADHLRSLHDLRSGSTDGRGGGERLPEPLVASHREQALKALNDTYRSDSGFRDFVAEERSRADHALNATTVELQAHATLEFEILPQAGATLEKLGTGRGHGEDVVGAAKKSLAEDLRAAVRDQLAGLDHRLAPTPAAIRAPGRAGDLLTTDALADRLRYHEELDAGIRQLRDTVDRRGGLSLDDAGLTRIGDEYAAKITGSAEQHLGDLRTGRRPLAYDRIDPRYQAFRKDLDALTTGVDRRIAHEAGLEGALWDAGQAFHQAFGGPGSYGIGSHEAGLAAEAGGFTEEVSAFRQDWITLHDRLTGDGALDVRRWLAHEQAGGDLFGKSLDRAGAPATTRVPDPVRTPEPTSPAPTLPAPTSPERAPATGGAAHEAQPPAPTTESLVQPAHETALGPTAPPHESPLETTVRQESPRETTLGESPRQQHVPRPDPEQQAAAALAADRERLDLAQQQITLELHLDTLRPDFEADFHLLLDSPRYRGGELTDRHLESARAAFRADSERIFARTYASSRDRGTFDHRWDTEYRQLKNLALGRAEYAIARHEAVTRALADIDRTLDGPQHSRLPEPVRQAAKRSFLAGVEAEFHHLHSAPSTHEVSRLNVNWPYLYQDLLRGVDTHVKAQADLHTYAESVDRRFQQILDGHRLTPEQLAADPWLGSLQAEFRADALQANPKWRSLTLKDLAEDLDHRLAVHQELAAAQSKLDEAFTDAVDGWQRTHAPEDQLTDTQIGGIASDIAVELAKSTARSPLRGPQQPSRSPAELAQERTTGLARSLPGRLLLAAGLAHLTADAADRAAPDLASSARTPARSAIRQLGTPAGLIAALPELMRPVLTSNYRPDTVEAALTALGEHLAGLVAAVPGESAAEAARLQAWADARQHLETLLSGRPPLSEAGLGRVQKWFAHRAMADHDRLWGEGTLDVPAWISGRPAWTLAPSSPVGGTDGTHVEPPVRLPAFPAGSVELSAIVSTVLDTARSTGAIGRVFDPSLSFTALDATKAEFVHLKAAGKGQTRFAGEDVDGFARTPWNSGKPLYTAIVHGSGVSVTVSTPAKDGTTRTSELPGPAFGEVLRRRPSLRGLGGEAQIILAACKAADSAQDRLAIGQSVADRSGHVVWAATTDVVVTDNLDRASFGLLPDEQGRPGRWVMFLPSPGRVVRPPATATRDDGEPQTSASALPVKGGRPLSFEGATMTTTAQAPGSASTHPGSTSTAQTTGPGAQAAPRTVAAVASRPRDVFLDGLAIGGTRYQALTVPGDGDCFFTSLLTGAHHQLGDWGRQDLHVPALRGAASDWLRGPQGAAYRAAVDGTGRPVLSVLLGDFTTEQLWRATGRPGPVPTDPAAWQQLIDEVSNALHDPVAATSGDPGAVRAATTLSQQTWARVIRERPLLDRPFQLTPGSAPRRLAPADWAALTLSDAVDLAIRNPALWTTQFFDEVPQVTARAVGLNLVVLDRSGRAVSYDPQPGQASVHVYRSDAGGIGGAHYSALRPTGPVTVASTAATSTAATTTTASTTTATTTTATGTALPAPATTSAGTPTAGTPGPKPQPPVHHGPFELIDLVVVSTPVTVRDRLTDSGALTTSDPLHDWLSDPARVLADFRRDPRAPEFAAVQALLVTHLADWTEHTDPARLAPLRPDTLLVAGPEPTAAELAGGVRDWAVLSTPDSRPFFAGVLAHGLGIRLEVLGPPTPGAADSLLGQAGPPSGPTVQALLREDGNGQPVLRSTGVPGLYAPPTRITLDGQLSSSDRVLPIGGDPDLVTDALLAELADTLTPSQLAHAKEQLSTELSLPALQPLLSGMTRGDSLSIPLDVGGWQGHIEVTAMVVSAATTGTFKKLEFEDGSDSFDATGFFKEGRSRFGGGLALKGKAPSETALTGQLGVIRDRTSGRVVATSARMFTRGKTPEPALRVTADVRLSFDFGGVRRPGAAPARTPATITGRPDARVDVRLPVLVAVPAADADHAPRPANMHDYRPPRRIEQTLALGGSDIVKDVYALAADGRRSGGGVRALLGDPADPASPESLGRRQFGADWPEIREEFLGHVSLLSLHTELKGMTAGEPVEVTLSGGRGTILISAQVATMTHRRNTDQTEFNTGTDVTRTITSSSTHSWSGQAPFSGQQSGIGDVPARMNGAVSGQYGRDRTALDQMSMRAGNAVKMKVPGAVFDGVAQLVFSYRKDPEAGREPLATDMLTPVPTGPAPAVAIARLGFQVLVEAAEAQRTDAPQPFVATARPKGPLRLEAPEVAVGEIAWRPRAEIWGLDPLATGGLPESSVVYDVFAGPEPAQGGQPARSLGALLGDLGRQFFGRNSWSELRPSVRNSFSRDRISALLPAMSRKVPAQSPLLTRPRRPDAQVSATAQLTSFEFLRVIDKAELNVLNEVVESSAGRQISWHAGGVQAQAGLQTDFTEETGLGLPLVGGGAARRRREGARSAHGSGAVSSGKFPEPMVAFIVTARVDVEISEAGTADGRATGQTDVRFVVALPKSLSEQYVVGEGGQGQQISTRARAEAEAAAAAATTAAPGSTTTTAPGTVAPPLRFGPPAWVSEFGQIGPSDSVTALTDGMALMTALHAELGPAFGADWDRVKADLLPFFDPVALRPLLPALTSDKRWGTTVGADGITAEITIVSAAATMTEYLKTIKDFEFEIGTESFASAGAMSDDQTTWTGTGALAVKAPHVSVTASHSRASDNLVGSTLDSAANAVSKGKTVEPAALFKGQVAFTVEIALSRTLGLTTDRRTVTATAEGEFAFPVRDLPLDPATGLKPVPAQYYSPPPGIAKSLVLNASAIVLNVMPDPQAAAQAAAANAAAVAAAAAAGSTVPVPQPPGSIPLLPFVPPGPLTGALAPSPRTPGDRFATTMVLDRLDATGLHVFGSPGAWARVKRGLAKKFTADRLQPRMKALMAGQPWVIALNGGGTVTVTASIEELTHTGNTKATEFNSGSTSGVIGGATDGLTASTTGSSQTTAVQVVGTTDPLGVLPAAVIAGGTLTHVSGRDEIAESSSAGRTGVGTKSKVPGSVFDGVALLHFEFRRPWRPRGKAVDQRIPIETPARQHRLDLIQARIEALTNQVGAEAEIARLTARYDAGVLAEETRIRAAAQAKAAAAAAGGVMTPMTRPAFGVRQHAHGYAKVGFQALVETADAVEAAQPADAHFVARQPATPEQRAVEAVHNAETVTLQVPPPQVWEHGLAAHYAVRDLPDVGSLRSLVDTEGRRIYRGAWDTTLVGGRKRADLVLDAFSREKLWAGLPQLTAGKELRSAPFRVNGRQAWVSVTAEVVDLAYHREEPGAEVALVGETTARTTERKLNSRHGQFMAQLGAEFSKLPGKFGAVLTFGGGYRRRKGGEQATGGRVTANSKIPIPLVHFDGHVKFRFTFHHGTSGKSEAKAVRAAGVVPFAVSVPKEEVKRQLRGPRSTFFTKDRPLGTQWPPVVTPATAPTLTVETIEIEEPPTATAATTTTTTTAPPVTVLNTAPRFTVESIDLGEEDENLTNGGAAPTVPATTAAATAAAATTTALHYTVETIEVEAEEPPSTTTPSLTVHGAPARHPYETIEIEEPPTTTAPPVTVLNTAPRFTVESIDLGEEDEEENLTTAAGPVFSGPVMSSEPPVGLLDAVDDTASEISEESSESAESAEHLSHRGHSHPADLTTDADQESGPPPREPNASIRQLPPAEQVGRVREYLDGLDVITLAVSAAPGLGHQSSSVAVLRSLRDLGYRGEVVVAYPPSTSARIDQLLPGPAGAPERSAAEDPLGPWRKQPLDEEFNPFSSGTSRPPAGLPRTSLTVTGAFDGLTPHYDNGYTTAQHVQEQRSKVLDHFNTDAMLVLQPYAWPARREFILRPGPGGPLTIDVLTPGQGDLQGLGEPALTDALLPPGAMFRAEESTDFDLGGLHGSPAAQGLSTLKEALGTGRVDLMPVYGLHQSQTTPVRTVLGYAAEGLHAALDRTAPPTVVVVIGAGEQPWADAVDCVQPDADGHRWLTTTALTAPDLADTLDALVSGDVLLLDAGSLPRPAFHWLFAQGTLPALVMANGTANLLRVLERPFLPLLTDRPLHPPTGSEHDTPALQLLHDTALALTAGPSWGALADLAEHQESLLTELGEQIGKTGSSTGLPPEFAYRALGFTDRASLDRLRDELETLREQAPPGSPLAGPAIWPAATVPSRSSLESWHQALATERDRIGQLLADHSGGGEAQLTPAHVATVTEAMRQLRDPGSTVSQYFTALAEQGRDPKNDQVRQGFVAVVERLLPDGGFRYDGDSTTRSNEPGGSRESYGGYDDEYGGRDTYGGYDDTYDTGRTYGGHDDYNGYGGYGDYGDYSRNYSAGGHGGSSDRDPDEASDTSSLLSEDPDLATHQPDADADQVSEDGYASDSDSDSDSDREPTPLPARTSVPVAVRSTVTAPPLTTPAGPAARQGSAGLQGFSAGVHPPARLEADPGLFTGLPPQEQEQEQGPVPATAAGVDPTTAPSGLPLLVARDLVNGRLEAVNWHPSSPGRAVGLLRYRVGGLDLGALAVDHPLQVLAGGGGRGGRPPRILHVHAMLPDDSEGRAQEIAEALLGRVAKVAAAENADQVVVDAAGAGDHADLLAELGLRPEPADGHLWRGDTSDLVEALRRRPPVSGDLKVTNCESG